MIVRTSTISQTGILTIGRAAIFYACNKLLLRPVYLDLRGYTLSSGTSPDADSDAELDQLPTPNTSNSPAFSRTRAASSHSVVSRWSFSLCFSESCILFLLFLFQEIGIFTAESRVANWKISLNILLFMILLVIPLSQTFLLTYQSPLGKVSRRRSMPTRVLFALIPYTIYLFALSFIPIPEHLASTTLRSAALLRLIVLGVFIIGLLSGLGAVRNAWDTFPSISSNHRRSPSKQELSAAEEALDRVRRDIQERRKEERRLQEAGKSSSSSSWMGKIASSLSGNSELTSIQRELTGLLALEYQMDRKIDTMRRMRDISNYNKTMQGRIIQWASRFFALYWIFRTVSSILNILSPYDSHKPSENGKTNSYPDLIAHFLTYLFSLLPSIHLSTENISAVSKQISLLLVGGIILSSIRFILKSVSRFLKLTSQNLGASLLLLILAQLMGTYLIATLVQLRTAFPPSKVPPNADPVSPNVFSTLPAYEVVGSGFDYSYLLSVFATGIYLWTDEKINGGYKQDEDL